jgi:hypothetical protein
MNNHQSKTAFVVLAAAIAAVFMSSIVLATTEVTPKKVMAQRAQEEIKGDGTDAVRTLADEPKKQSGGEKIKEEKIKGSKKRRAEELAVVRAPIAISGNNVYIAWWSNKTGNDEVMFRASTDNGVTFGNKINLSNTTEADSQDAEISASANKVYVTWWERNQTSEEPVLRISSNNGATFGPIMKLASNGTIGGGATGAGG